jgi:hypothetical protein
MNESQFESDLRRLQPAAPSAEMAERIGSELSTDQRILDLTVQTPHRLERVPAQRALHPRTSQPLFSWLRGLAWATAGACAALLAMRGAEFFSPQPTPGNNSQRSVAAAEFQPNSSSRELLQARDEGLLYDDEQAPQRQLRLTFLERHTWTNPATGAVLHFEVPREDVVLTPVAMQ